MSSPFVLPDLGTGAQAQSKKRSSEVWREPLRKFVEARESNGKCCSGLFNDQREKARFVERLAEGLALAAKGSEGDFDDEVVVLALQTARMLMCDRDQILEPLFATGSLEAYSSFVLKDLGSDTGTEALKCLNNALYDQALVQARYCALERERGYEALVQALGQHDDLSAFHRACFVAMYLTAGNQEAEDLSMSVDFGKMCLGTMVAVANALPSDDKMTHLELFSGEDKSKPERDALCAGLRLLYAVSASHPAVVGTFHVESLAVLAALSDGGTDAEVAEMLDNLVLDDDRAPPIDRVGLLLSMILGAELPAGNRGQTEDGGEDEDEADEVEDEDEVEALRNEAAALRAEGVELQLLAVNVVMMALELDGFAQRFDNRGGAEALVGLLEAKVGEVMLLEEGSSFKAFGELLPIVIACLKLCERSPSAHALIKARVFPRTKPAVDVTGLSKGKATSLLKKRQVEGDTPDDVLGAHLIKFLTCLESNLKRCTGELLLALCDDDTNEFTARCGYGNAAHMMAIKGGMMGDILKQQEEERGKRLSAKKLLKKTSYYSVHDGASDEGDEEDDGAAVS